MDVRIIAMSPTESSSAELEVDYAFAATPLGEMLVASTGEGICRMAFADDRAAAVAGLRGSFPRAILRERPHPNHARALAFVERGGASAPVELHIHGTEFQLKVWRALLAIPRSQTSTYGRVAASLGTPRASRAVGGAVGANPVAVIIPCHRVVRADGAPGGYMWGPRRKKALLDQESELTVSNLFSPYSDRKHHP